MNQKHEYYVSPEIDEDLKIKGKMAWKNVLEGFAKPKTFEKMIWIFAQHLLALPIPSS